MRVRGGCAILWRQQGVSQIGTSPGRRTIVSDLSLAEQRLLDEFARNLESTGVYRAARRSRVPVARAREIVADLERQGVLVASATSELGGADGVYWDRLGIDANATGAKVSLSVPARNLSDALALAVSALREPVFPKDVFQERRDQVLTGIEAQRHQPEALAAEAMAVRGHAYPADDPRHYRTMDEVVTDLKAQTPERLMKFWQDFAGASQGQFSVVGNVDPEALKAELQKLLGDWKSPQA